MREAADSMGLSKNSFDCIRLFAAIQVMFGHAVAHFELNTLPLINEIWSLFPGVIILFAISGYLITASLDRNTNKFKSGRILKTYFSARFLRVYPALWVALIVSLVTIMITHKVSASPLSFVTWVVAQITVGQFYTADFLRGFGVGTPNGSLWTISVEVQFYIAIFLFYGACKKMTKRKWALFLVIAAFINVAFGLLENGYSGHMAIKILDVLLLPYIVFFAIGSFAYFHMKTVVIFLKKRFWWIFVGYLVWSVLNKTIIHLSLGSYINIVSGMWLCLLTISAAYYFGDRRLPFDISYGIYLYHMIVINVFVQCKLLHSWTMCLLAFAITVIMASISWYLIEKPCIQLKERISQAKNV